MPPFVTKSMKLSYAWMSCLYESSLSDYIKCSHPWMVCLHGSTLVDSIECFHPWIAFLHGSALASILTLEWLAHMGPPCVTFFNVLNLAHLAHIGPPWVTFTNVLTLGYLLAWVYLGWFYRIWRWRSRCRRHQLDENALWFEGEGCRIKEEYYVVVAPNLKENACVDNTDDEAILPFSSFRGWCQPKGRGLHRRWCWREGGGFITAITGWKEKAMPLLLSTPGWELGTAVFGPLLQEKLGWFLYPGL